MTIERGHAERRRLRPRARRRLPGAARPVRRRRHGAGAARARERPVRRRRRARVGGRHGQGGDEAGVRGAGAADLRLRGRAEARLAARRARRSCSASSTASASRCSSSRPTSDRASASRRRSTSPSCATAIDLAAEFDRKIVVEAAVPQRARDRVAVLGNDEPEASVPGEIIPSREFYDYEAKYLDGDSRDVIPADLPANAGDEIRALAIAAFKRDRLRRHGARRLPARRRQRHAVRQRGQHHSRLHDHQHVLEDVGRERCRLSRAPRSADRARDRTPRRKQQLRTSM